MAKKDVIDAGEEFDRIDGERGASRLGEQRKPTPQGAKLFLVVVIAAVLGAGGFVTWKAMGIMENANAGESEAVEPQVALNKAGADWQPKPIMPEPEPEPSNEADAAAAAVVAASTPAPAQGTAPQQRPEGPTPEELIRMRRLAPNLNTNTSGNQQSQAQAQPGTSPSSGSGSGPLADNLQPVRLSGARAGVLKNRDMLITQGSMLDCQLETKIVSTVPGMTTCYTTRDIYSTNGRVVLLDRGSKVVGQYQGGMTQGQARIFVLWTRVETPTGVIINLDSPGTGPLGEGGLGGWVDTHFWERFKGAIMLSMIGDIGNFLSNKASQGNADNQITFEETSDAGQDMASIALENSINIPPTLYKNQGERLQIFVARDLDFSGVYSLERSN
ncbi:type IV secretion system protein VirB10 [Pseudomonas peli]|uniref:Type IV secretion system protein VirB10 n=1 Tax=Pseudomonas peli TaxID=592361 RepID=A0AB37ZDC3_9PSED|nr:type IV secretion system protein VirB10 [Pseudomonas peli]NMZ71415.1 TrbI/VirB10 family protein [Pseudomonas peli]SCW89631.1 type IV secretion system protein VirB10 [Pseudomonas peli]